MKRKLFFVTAIAFAALASCNKFSELDETIVNASSTETPITFSTYASSAATTKGTAVNTNSDFQTTHGSFDVIANVSDVSFYDYVFYNTASNGNQANSIYGYAATATTTTSVNYFNFSNVTYKNNSWVNTNDMYWPNYSKLMHFAAYSPASANISSSSYEFTVTHSEGSDYTWTPKYYYPSDGSISAISGAKDSTTTKYTNSYSYSFPYTVSDAINSQVDLMYAMTTVPYMAPSDKYKYDSSTITGISDYSYVTTGVGDTNQEADVNLHFKHALTQIAFTATKDDDIDVYVKSITICNVYNSGTFTATQVTDDDDADAENDTIGDDDLVNAENFGTWEANYKGTWTLEDGTTTDGTGITNGLTAGGGGFSAMSNYAARLYNFSDQSPTNTGDYNSIKINSGTNATALTAKGNVLMLMPQKLTAWVPSTSVTLNYIGSYSTNYPDGVLGDGEIYANPSMTSSDRTLSYLAIDCEIYHAGIEDPNAKIHDGYIFIPFETKDIKYSEANTDNTADNADEWLAGYKITYCLNFGGGYVVEEGHTQTIPEPGTIPDTETYTLRTITYTTTVDDWVDVDDDIVLGEYDTQTETGTFDSTDE
ncbi:MAG: hypothetical protein R3Y26_06230 [Rikenellaceae bacterium]